MTKTMKQALVLCHIVLAILCLVLYLFIPGGRDNSNLILASIINFTAACLWAVSMLESKEK